MSGAPRFVLGTVPMQSGATDEVLDAFFAAGGRDLDTARAYGASEESIGRWMRRAGVADEVRVVTKGGCPPPGDATPRLSRAEVLADAERSLEYLGTSSVAGYLLHRDDPARDTDDIAETLIRLVERGMTAAVGVSNWTTERVERLIGSLARAEGPRLSFVSNYFGLAVVQGRDPNPGVRTTTAGHFDLAERHGFALLAWSPLSSGYFASRSARRSPLHENERSAARRTLLHDIAERRGVPAVAVLARWVGEVSPQLRPVFGCSTVAHLRELVAAESDESLDDAVAELRAELGAAELDCGAYDD